MNKIKLIVFLSTFLFPFLVKAQDYYDDVNDVPVDGGLSLLISAGIGYGIKKVHSKKKQKL